MDYAVARLIAAKGRGANHPLTLAVRSAADARDPDHAVELWTQSENHLSVILNRGIWAEPRWRWQALGAVYFKGYGCAWFGNVADT